MFTPEGGLPHQGTPTTICLSPWHSTSEQTLARGRQQLMSNNTAVVIVAEGYQKIVNLLGGVNELQSCQNYLATQDCSNDNDTQMTRYFDSKVVINCLQLCKLYIVVWSPTCICILLPGFGQHYEEESREGLGETIISMLLVSLTYE